MGSLVRVPNQVVCLFRHLFVEFGRQLSLVKITEKLTFLQRMSRAPHCPTATKRYMTPHWLKISSRPQVVSRFCAAVLSAASAVVSCLHCQLSGQSDRQADRDRKNGII